MTAQKPTIEKELEKNIAHRHIQGDTYYCEFCRVNLAIQNTMKELNRDIDKEIKDLVGVKYGFMAQIKLRKAKQIIEKAFGKVE